MSRPRPKTPSSSPSDPTRASRKPSSSTSPSCTSSRRPSRTPASPCSLASPKVLLLPHLLALCGNDLSDQTARPTATTSATLRTTFSSAVAVVVAVNVVNPNLKLNPAAHATRPLLPAQAHAAARPRRRLHLAHFETKTTTTSSALSPSLKTVRGGAGARPFDPLAPLAARCLRCHY